MTNADKIRKMSDEELAEYIDAVFKAGVYFATHKEEEMTLYNDWLKEEA